jgi:hypothetical protein
MKSMRLIGLRVFQRNNHPAAYGRFKAIDSYEEWRARYLNNFFDGILLGILQAELS